MTGPHSKEGLTPQEKPVLTAPLNRTFTLGLPRERRPGETRVALTPTAVAMLVQAGVEVKVERHAGQSANFRDLEYSEAGAKIFDNPAEVWDADLIAKVLYPTEEETQWMRHRQVIFSMIDLRPQGREVLFKMIKKRLSAIAIERIHSSEETYPLMELLGELGGELAMFVAAELLSNVHGGKGILLGGIAGAPPSEVLILGAGPLGASVARQALAVGAEVKIFDDAIHRLRQVRLQMPHPIYTSTIHTAPLLSAFRTADVVVAAFHKSSEGLPYVVPRDFVRQMKEGSVIIDLNIEDGGAFATSRQTSHDAPTYVEEGITHYCVPNITARVALTASIVLSNFYLPLLLRFGQSTSFDQFLLLNRQIRSGTYLYNGLPTHPLLSRYWNIPTREIDLLVGGFS